MDQPGSAGSAPAVFASSVRGRMHRIRAPIHAHTAFVLELDIPNDQRAGVEVVAAFGRQPRLGDRSVIVAAPDLHSEERGPIQKVGREMADIESGVRTEGFAVRQLHSKSDVLAERVSQAG
jgi:hypothetical protein